MAPSPPPIKTSTSHTASKRIVLVEDDESVRHSMAMLLRTRGYQIEAYRNGVELLLMNGPHGGDCLLIDYKMPRLDGLELMRRLRSHNDQTPAIMVTGFYSSSLLRSAQDAGYSTVIEKPATPTLLFDSIESTTGSH